MVSAGCDIMNAGLAYMAKIDKRVLVVVSNPDLRKTIAMELAEYFPEEKIYESADERDALWQASAVFPEVLITSFNEERVRASDLLVRIRNLNHSVKGFVVYSPESAEYERALKDALYDNMSYAGMAAVRLEDLRSALRVAFGAVGGAA